MDVHVHVHCLTFEPLGVDLLDETSVDISRDKPWLSNDVSEDRNVVADPWREGERGEGRGGREGERDGKREGGREGGREGEEKMTYMYKYL